MGEGVKGGQGEGVRERGGRRERKVTEKEPQTFAELSRLDCISLDMMVVYYVACVLHLLHFISLCCIYGSSCLSVIRQLQQANSSVESAHESGQL